MLGPLVPTEILVINVESDSTESSSAQTNSKQEVRALDLAQNPTSRFPLFLHFGVFVDSLLEMKFERRYLYGRFRSHLRPLFRRIGLILCHNGR